MINKAVKLLEKYIEEYTVEYKHKTSPAMIKFYLEPYYQAIAELKKIKVKKQPTWDEFRFHYSCEWDTDEFLGWDELRICLEQLRMIEIEDW